MSSLSEVQAKIDAHGERPQKDPMGHLYVEEMLRNAHFKGDISSNKGDLDKFSTDESIFSVRPQIVIAPKTKTDLEIATKVIDVHTDTFPTLSLTVRAAGTGLSGGSLSDSIIVDTTRYLNHIGEYDEQNDAITVEPGAMFRDVEKKLKAHGRYLPSYPASKDMCAIGGCVGNNAAGPDSLKYGHFAEYVKAIDVVLYDGNTYTLKPLSFDAYKALIQRDNAHAKIAKAVYELIKKNEEAIRKSKPLTKKNTAGYPLWDVVTPSVKLFEAGHGVFDLTRLIAGSQGTIGVMTAITLRTEPIHNDTVLLTVPIYDLEKAGEVIVNTLQYKPTNVELYDGTSFELAKEHVNFFRDRIPGFRFYQFLLALYWTYYITYRRQVPEFTLLITIDTTATEHSAKEIVEAVRKDTGAPISIVNNEHFKGMFWQLRRASYSLSKLQDNGKRPAAFLEDMIVPPEHISAFFSDIKQLLTKHNVTAAIHGHGGDGHLHFYPLLDFTKDQRSKVEAMAEDFFNAACKYHGSICGEHNDGIIRTPHLSRIYPKTILKLFEQVEKTCDPKDIFNPGKKVNPRYDIKKHIRTTN